MSRRQLMVGLLFASLFGGIIALGGYKLFEKDNPSYMQVPQNNNVKFSNYLNDSSFIVPAGLNFVYAAELVTPGVVHIKSTVSSSARSNPHGSPFDDMFRDYFGAPRDNRGRQRPEESAGSGVIVSHDGYIVTNNHVIADADKLEVTLNDNRTYEATLIGTDPNTDIAVIQIDETNLPYVNFGNSDLVRVGEWVLAVGNPFNLISTVTAGIVSAKGRNIGILREQYGIESFIQTDAAVNPGNSGGPLVNLKGELIGINTAIATPTGAYTGYSFAVPVSLVEKVVEDLIEHGIVQRAVLGIVIVNVNDPRLDEEIDDLKGVYVNAVNAQSAAEEAGLKKGDIILEINDTEVANVAELQDLVARNRPGDKIDVTYKRDGKVKKVSAKLKNLDNEVKIVKRNDAFVIEGASLRNATKDEMEDYDVQGGVIIDDIDDGKWKDAGIENGFLITSITNQPVKEINELRSILREASGYDIVIKGKYPSGKKGLYAMGW
jgi:serine protease Do